MSEFFRTSKVWVVDFRFEGHPRRWFKALPEGADAPGQMAAALQALHGRKAQCLSVRRATEEEESQYLRGEVPVNACCPTLQSGKRYPAA